MSTSSGIPKFCSNCGRKPTKNRTLNEHTAICSDCTVEIDDNPIAASQANHPSTTYPHPPAPPCDIDDSPTLNNVTFGALNDWLTATYTSHVAHIDQRLTKEINQVKEDVDKTKTDLANTNNELMQLKKNLTDFKRTSNENAAALEQCVRSLEEESKKHKMVSDNNLKYLVNLDRNNRRQNICVFGVPENDLRIDGSTATTDKDKCGVILTYIGVPVLDQATDIFRLGKPTADSKPRPIKLKFPSSEGPKI